MNASRTTRRTILRRAGVGGLGLAGVGIAGCGSDEGTTAATSTETAATASTSTPACVLSPEMTEGPYYVDLEQVRRDVTEDSAGLPLKLEIKVVDSTECEPLAGAAVDIWHCDAFGVYSGIDSEGTSGETFLRGVQLTGDDGVATFETIFPGWYQGRVTHIHLKVHEGGTVDGSTYSGGDVAHTGQLFFPDKLTDSVYELEPYADHEGTRTLLSADGIYLGGDGARVHATELTKGKLENGLLGRITLGVDPSATPEDAGIGGAAPPDGGMPPEGGMPPGGPPPNG